MNLDLYPMKIALEEANSNGSNKNLLAVMFIWKSSDLNSLNMKSFSFKQTNFETNFFTFKLYW